MTTAKIAITLDQTLLQRIDQLVKKHIFTNRSKAIQEAVCEKLEKINKNRLLQECLKLNSAEEQTLAEEGLGTELKQWPPY